MSGRPISNSDVAIVGMACRFPGASTVDEYWQMLCSGKSMHTRVPSTRFSQGSRWRLGNIIPEFWGNFLDRPEVFDHKFFGISPREATSMDPQQRLALQIAYETVESAGYFHCSTKTCSIGVFLGVGSVDYQDNVSTNLANAFSALGTLRAFISGRISHHFGWTGPSITYDTSCSSSAVAIHSACKALLSDECSAALAGGVNVITSPLLYEDLSKSGFLSPSGPCKPFDAKADGYCRGEGAGMLYLKKFSVAIQDGDSILGIIPSSAVNHGDNSTPITVPHESSQTSLYQCVLDKSGIRASQIGLIEAHGTGTPRGDPIEFESIRKVFGPERSDTLYVTSVKANIGHTEAASGVAAAIKAILVIQNGSVPKQANFEELNPKINLPLAARLEIPMRTQAWRGHAVFVNNYGAAGSNAAFIVSKPDTSQAMGTFSSSDDIQQQKYPIIITGHSDTSLRSYCSALRNYLIKGSSFNNQAVGLPDLGFGLARRVNQSLAFSFSASVVSIPELKTALMEPESRIRGNRCSKQPMDKSVVMCFGGQSKTSIGLRESVYRNCTLLRMHLDSCESICQSNGILGFYPQIFSTMNTGDIVLLHCMLFSIQYASARAWIESGLPVDVLIGHSFGYLTALCVAEVLSLEQALSLVIERARLIKERLGAEKGAMLSVKSTAEQLTSLLASISYPPSVSPAEVACYNGPEDHVLSGSESAIRAVEEAISAGIRATQSTPMRCRRLDVTHAFHSHVLDPILPELARLAGTLHYQKPKIHLEACIESSKCLVDKEMIVRHSREPVWFWQAAKRIAARGPRTWIEAGSESGIMNLIHQAIPTTLQTQHTFHPISLTRANSMDSLADTTVQLWQSGVRVQFWSYHRMQRSYYRGLNLPPYQFEKPSHWLELRESSNTECPTPKVNLRSRLLSLLSFVRPQNDQRSIAEFRVDAYSPQFKSYMEGHKVLGYSSCPASVYLHLVAQALVELVQKESAAPPSLSGFRIEKLVMPTPFRDNVEQTIVLQTESYDDSPDRWTFRIISRSTKRFPTETSHATGMIYLDTAPQSKITDEDVGSDHTSHYNVEQKIAGPFIYNVFSTIVDYAENFRGIKSISTDARGIVGRVLLPISRGLLYDPSFCNPLLIDNFIQVAGFHVEPDRTNKSAPDQVVEEPKPKAGGVSRSEPLGQVKSLAPTTNGDNCDMRVATSDMKEDSRLEEVGIDSLVIIELLDAIEKEFDVNISLSEYEQVKTLGSLAQHIESRASRIGGDSHGPEVVTRVLNATEKPRKTAIPNSDDINAKPTEHVGENKAFTTKTVPSSLDLGQKFEGVQADTVRYIQDCNLEGFTRHVAVHLQDLVVAYIVEAFAQLGIRSSDEAWNSLKSGVILPKYEQLTAQLLRILEETGAIQTGDRLFVRLSSQEERKIHLQTLQKTCSDFPQHCSQYQLLAAIGARLADCLSGREDPLHLLFGNKSNRNLLTEVYTNAPIFSTGTRLLSTFISRVISSEHTGAPLRILEIGGGVGGTTASIVRLLDESNRSFIYTFTDISPSLVAAARKNFAGHDRMDFRALDVESSPDGTLLGSQDIIISTNTIHATESLSESCANMRRMLVNDGLLCLVELTRPLGWYDVVFGLLDGWWRFNDGRTHAIADMDFWEPSLREAGFENVKWTEGDHEDSDLIRLIVASGATTVKKEISDSEHSKATSIETVLFRQVEGIPLYADLYYPFESELTPSGRPIALLIHGGGHVMLSRKDIRPAQTKHLLDNGFIPISIDYRLCPELDLIDGPMTDVCHALEWIRHDLPKLKLQRPDIELDCTKVAAVGWSTGGTLALSLGWTAPARGLQPPEAILVFYCPTDYTSDWYKSPHFPWRTSEADTEKRYDLWEAVRDRPITGFNIASARTPGGWMSTQNARARIPLHMNWTGQTVPILLGELTSEKKLQRQQQSSSSSSSSSGGNGNLPPPPPPYDARTHLPMPPLPRIEAISPRAQIEQGNYATPTFFLHGSEDEFIPLEETRGTYEALRKKGVRAGIKVVEGGGHMFEMLGLLKGDERVWGAVVEGYRFLGEVLRERGEVRGAREVIA
ncbi:MAG: hypothetical protein Q9219_002090 [cf. Caloplaca sp. 3 TL-2023]